MICAIVEIEVLRSRLSKQVTVSSILSGLDCIYLSILREEILARIILAVHKIKHSFLNFAGI